MADSVDRVFVHALNTVKRIPKTGATRPPPPDRLRLYGLYKQAMEGDVDGVMERPVAVPAGQAADDLQREMDKWDAWNSQKGLSRTEAKRRYIEALVATMHRYATTPDARELVAEAGGRVRWSKKMERAMVKLSAEVAALREQISMGREWRFRKERSWQAWVSWCLRTVIKHVLADFVILALVLLWMRRRKDRRLEDLARAALRLWREYFRNVLPLR